MTLQGQAVRATLDLAKTHRLLADGEIREVMQIFDAKHPLAALLRLADCLHAHIKVDSTTDLPREALVASDGTVENEKDGYVKYVFASGMNLIFSSIAVSQDDLREKKNAGTRRARPFLDHVGIDLRTESADAKAIFDTVPSIAQENGWGHAAQGGDKPVYCCHVSVSAKHWVFTKDKPSIEIAYGPLTIDMAKSGCDLRPSDPTAGHR